MELGMFTSGYQRYPLERAFSDAGRLGYDYIELWGGRPHAFAPDLRLGGVAEIRSIVEKYQMPVYVYTPEHNAYPYNYMAGGRAQWEDSMEYLELCLEMGKALGAEYTLISVGHGGYSVPRRALWARLMESLRRLADRAEALDHKILLESLTPWESNLCTTAGELAQALEEVDSPCLLGMCDVVAPAAAGEPVENYLDLLGKKLAHLHLVDSDRHSDDHLIPGDGILPLPELLRELAERGYQGKATIELVTAYLSEPALYARRPWSGCGPWRRKICEKRAQARGGSYEGRHQAGRRRGQLHRPVRPDGGRLPRRKPGECCGIHRAAGG